MPRAVAIASGDLEIVAIFGDAFAVIVGLSTTTCVADNKRLVDAKIGFWQDLYKGPYGRFAVGAELEYLKRTSFGGIGGAPSTDNIVGFTSLRYYF